MRPLSWLTAMVLAALFLSATPREQTPVAAPPEKAKVEYRGNTKTYKFHQRSCRYYSCTNCTAEFKTREEAIKAGYRPCGTCDP